MNGAGFLYKHNNKGNIYVVTCNHILGDNNLETIKHHLSS